MASEKTLAAQSRKELAQLAKHNKVDGWHSMKKADLVQALKNRKLTKVPPKTSMRERIQSLRAHGEGTAHSPLRRTRSSSKTGGPGQPKSARPSVARLFANAPKDQKEQVQATAQGPHWIYASWWLTSAILERAEASLGTNWHQAAPVLKVYDIQSDEETSPTKRCVASIPIHAAVDHWYVPIAHPGRTYELQLHYETPKGHRFMLARSAPVKLPMPGTPQARKYEEQRQEGSPLGQFAEPSPRYPIRGASAFRHCDEVSLEVNAELLIAGQVSPGALLNCLEERVSVKPNGTFEIRLALEEGRQVIPLEAVSPDGCESRTVILAIERNTKTLEPQQLNEWDD